MLPSIAKLASSHGIVPLKKYGQNFIFDETLCDKIVSYANITPKSHVLEIGPGVGGLTRSILKSKTKKFSLIETDSRCLPLLEDIKNIYSFLDIRHNDALQVKLSDISTNTKLDIISNLPYNIGTALLVGWLSQIDKVKSITLMLQKEVVDRIVSSPNQKSYGRLSVICQIICDVYKCFNVSPNAFYPKPKVWSSIVRLVPRSSIISEDILLKLEEITNHAFSGRRKMLKSSLKQISPDIENILNALSINPSLRAENISPQEYLLLAKSL